MTELKHMKDNYDYMQDYATNTQPVLQIENLEEQSQDIVKEIADQNVELSKRISETQEKNTELKVEYDAKR